LSRPGPPASPGAIIFFVLLGVTLAAAALVVGARTPDLVLEVVELSPRELTVAESEERAATRIAFFVREDDPGAGVSIVDRDEQVIRSLAGPVPLEAERVESYSWDGRTDAGELAPAGRYRLRVELPDRGRDMIWPRPIILDREPSGERDEPSS
jgi:hypothetical protein